MPRPQLDLSCEVATQVLFIAIRSISYTGGSYNKANHDDNNKNNKKLVIIMMSEKSSDRKHGTRRILSSQCKVGKSQ